MSNIINASVRIIQSSDNTGTLELQANSTTGLYVNAGGMYVKSVTSNTRLAMANTNGMLVYDNTLNALYINANTAWLAVTTTSAANPRAIFGYGNNGTSAVSMTNLVSSTGVVATDTIGVGTTRSALAACGYGTDKAIFGYGSTTSASGGQVSLTNLVSNAGIVATDTTGVGTARWLLAAAGYGTDKGIFGYGTTTAASGGGLSMTNLVTNTGVVGNDVTGVGTARWTFAAAGYGTDKAIFGYGYTGSARLSITSLVTNTGVVGNDVTNASATVRADLAATTYGTDKAIFGYGFAGSPISWTNLVTNTGVLGNDVTGVGTARSTLAAAAFGILGKAIFGYGNSGSNTNITNIVDNTGVVATDTTGVGTSRNQIAAAAYG